MTEKRLTWAQRHPEANNAYHRAYRKRPEVRAKRREWQREWRARNPGAAAKYRRISGQRQRQRIYKRDAGICWLCGKPVEPTKFHLDHLIPSALDGPARDWNLRVAHPFCNQSKGDKIVDFEVRVGAIQATHTPPELADALDELRIGPGKARFLALPDGSDWLIVDVTGRSLR